MEESYKLMSDGKVEFTFKTDDADLTGVDDKTVIGKFYNMSVSYIKDKETALKDLQEQYNKFSKDLYSINSQLNAIDISDSLAEELKEFVENTAEVLKAVREIKDFTNEGYVANNPKKFGKMLKEARTLKENVIGELKEIDKLTGLHNKKTELLAQKKLYDEQVSKISRQLSEVEQL